MRNRVIGGEFELQVVPNVEPHIRDCFCYASGRTALYHILKSIRPSICKVWLPDWLCGSLIDAVNLAGVDYGFYALGNDLRMNVGDFVDQERPDSDCDVIVLVNYFGLVDIDKTITELRSLGVYSKIIEDDVQALFSFLDLIPHKADYRFTSLRKSIAAPDGGLVWTKCEMPLVNKENTFAPFKLMGALIKGAANNNSDDSEYLKLFERGEELIDENYSSVMSKDAAMVFTATDLQAAANKRRENARFLIAELLTMGIEPLLSLSEGQVPLFLPIMINNRDDIRFALKKNSIFCPVHWPLRDDMQQLSMGRLMAEKELSLVVDQRYNSGDMQSIVDVLKEWICK